MNADGILSLFFSLTAAVVVTFLLRLRRIPRTYITDYMRGVRFMKGAFVGVLGPGGHQALTRHEHIEVIDMRPVPVVLESISYRDALQADSVISIGAEMLVDDPYLAATSLKNRISDSLPIVREALRTTVARTIADRTAEFRSKVAGDIQTAVNDELNRLGMKISNVEITEVLSRNVRTQLTTKGLN